MVDIPKQVQHLSCDKLGFKLNICYILAELRSRHRTDCKNILMSSEKKRPVILIVEDDPIILLGVIDDFEASGFEVIDASSADIALLRFEERADIVALFTDAHMRGRLNGVELAKMVRDRRPGIEVMVTSGVVSLDTQVELDALPFIAKPYDGTKIAMLFRDTLRAKVRSDIVVGE